MASQNAGLHHQLLKVISSNLAFVMKTYVYALEHDPVRTKAVSSCILAMAGDIIAQLIQTRNQPHAPLDVLRVVKYGTFGLIFTGPALHHWFKLLEKVAEGKTAILKVFLDQIIFRPFFLVALYFYLSLFNGGMETFLRSVRRDLFKMTITAWKYWTPAQLFNFWYVPLHLRVLFSNFMALVWNIYFSLSTPINTRPPTTITPGPHSIGSTTSKNSGTSR